jgi:hypothetical protein
MTVSGVEDRALVLHTGERLRPEDTEGWRILAASDGHVVIDIDTAAALVAVAPEAVTAVRDMLDALVADPGSLPFPQSGASGPDGSLRTLKILRPVPPWPAPETPLLALAQALSSCCPALRVRAHRGALGGCLFVLDMTGVDPDEPLVVMVDRHERQVDVWDSVVTVRFAATRRRFFSPKPADTAAIVDFVRDIIDERIVVARAGGDAWWCRRDGGTLLPLSRESTTSWEPLHAEVRSLHGSADRNLKDDELGALLAETRPPPIVGSFVRWLVDGLLTRAGFTRSG